MWVIITVIVTAQLLL